MIPVVYLDTAATTAVDLRLLKLHIRRLKDQAFGALRNEEAGHGAGNGERMDAR